MDTAAKILILGGLGSLIYAFTFGFILSRARLSDPEAEQLRLTQVHVVALWEGFMLLGLVWAVALSDLSSGLESLAAVLLVTAGALQLASNTIAWRQRLVNLFAPPRGITYQLAAANAVLAMVGLVILTVGGIRGL
jgi:F0F1-type ATP synthase membrane subunit c/vacuolar-type H+-ATPase subunit K